MRRWIVFVLAIAVPLTLAALYLGLRDPEREDSGSSSPSGGLERALLPPDPSVSGAAAPDDPGRSSVESGAGPILSWDSERSIWLEGRVVLPPDLPEDESARVLALTAARASTALGDGPDVALQEGASEKGIALLSEVALTSAGGFRLPLPPDARRAHLIVRGRYLFSPQTTDLELDALPAEIVLQPELGARISGRLRTEADLADSTRVLEGLEVQLSVVSRGSLAMMEGAAFSLRKAGGNTAAAGDGSFELTGIGTRYELRLLGLSRDLAASESDPLRLLPGEHRVLELVLQPGGHIRGRVIDAAGEPLEGARVAAIVGANFVAGRHGRRVRETQTDASGAYELRAVSPGVLSLRAELEGHLETTRRIEVRAGQLYQEQPLVLTEGGSISGRVLWPSRGPAAAVAVQAFFDMSEIGGVRGLNAVRGAFAESLSAEDGSFTISGLGAGPFVLSAQAPGQPQPSTEYSSDESPEDLDDSPAARRPWTARITGVRPGSSEHVLELARPLFLSGRVTDESGGAIERFQVRAMQPRRGLVPGFGSQLESARFEHPEGLFELGGLGPGSWEVRAQAAGFTSAAAVLVELPRTAGAPELVLSLLESASFAGRVVDPDGAPVAGAKIGLRVDSLHRMAMAFHGEEPPEVESAQDGSFILRELQPGTLTVVAKKEGYAASEPYSFDTGQGSPTQEVVLGLRRAGSLSGEVYGRNGERAVGNPVVVQVPNTLHMHQTGTDSEGRFSFPDLPPGTWEVLALPDEDSMASMLQGESGGLGGLLAGIRMKVVELDEGEDLHVVLGEPPPNPVHVHGRVSLGADPVPGAVLSFVAQQSQVPASLDFHTTDEEGRYSLQVPEPGEYLLVVQKMGPIVPENNLEIRARIPEGEEHELDVELPAARVSGRVFAPDGQAVGGARVTLSSEGAVPPGMFWGGQYSELETDAEGRYSISWLRAGTYSVAAGGAAYGSLAPKVSPYGRIFRHGVQLAEGEHLEGVDFRLQAAGAIEGIVRDADGLPASAAALFLRGAEGRLMERVSWTQTDAAGRFRFDSLAPGTYRVSARRGQLTSHTDGACVVQAKQTTTTELVLAPGSVLQVIVFDAQGHPTSASLRLSDSEGSELSGMFSLTELLGAFQSGTLGAALRRFGPLAPGRYRVEAQAADGTRAEEEVRLDGEPERRLELRLR